MKIIGSELKAFLVEGWPSDDWYWDHEEFEGEPDVSETYDTLLLGPLLYQGRGDDPSKGDGLDLAKLIRAWRRNKTTEIHTVEIPKDRRDQLVEFLKTINGVVRE